MATTVALLAAPPSLAGERQYVCSGQASGSMGEKVDVTIYQTPRGQRVATTASWDPPRLDKPARIGTAQPELTVSFLFPSPNAASIGPVGEGLVMVSVSSPPGRRGPAAGRKLDGMIVEVGLGPAPLVRIALTGQSGIPDQPTMAFRHALLPPQPAGAKLITVRLVDRKHRAVTTARYDISGDGDRAALFATAWDAAGRAAMHPEGCDLTVEGS